MAPLFRLPLPLLLTCMLLTACGGGGGEGNDNSPNTAPQLDLGNWQQTVDQSSFYKVQLTATDAERQALSFSADNLPSWLTLNAATGVVSGTPQQQHVGNYSNIVFSVSDSRGATTSSAPLQLTVVDIDAPPQISLSLPATIDGRSELTVNVTVSDPDGGEASWQLGDVHELIAEQQGNQLLLTIGNPTEVAAGSIEILASDDSGQQTTATFRTRVLPVTADGSGITLMGGSHNPGVHLVFLGDGYRQPELAKFRADVAAAISHFTADPGFTPHQQRWNIHLLLTPSQESGADSSVDRDSVDTVFDAGYNCFGIQRLLCVDDNKAFTAALAAFPRTQHVAVAVNDSRFGGSGGALTVFSAPNPEIVIHELGHSFAGLADEYMDASIADQYLPGYREGNYANVSNLNDPNRVPWSHWIEDKTDYPRSGASTAVGIFEGAYYSATGFYRPLWRSMMNENAPMGVVNAEQWALSMYESAGALQTVVPNAPRLTVANGEFAEFSIQPLFDDGTQEWDWYVDGERVEQAHNMNQLGLGLFAGEYQIKVIVRDTSGLIRKSPPHAGYVERNWTLEVTP